MHQLDWWKRSRSKEIATGIIWIYTIITRSEKTTLELELHGARFFSKIWKHNFKVSKNKSEFLDNDVLYEHTKSQPEMTYIIGLTKMKKSDRIWRIEFLHCSLIWMSDFGIFVQPKIRGISSWVFFLSW
jgi:hypothetical protein